MAAFIFRRTLWMGVVLFVVSLVTFYLMRAVPGGPFDREKELPPAIMANLEAKYNLDAPVWQQYTDYMGGLIIPFVDTAGCGERPPAEASEEEKSADRECRRVQNENDRFYLVSLSLGNDTTLRLMDFGPSFTDRSQTVSTLLKDQLPVSFQLGLAALMLALVIGIPSGVIAGLRRNTSIDYISMGVATVGVSITAITLGPILQYVFGLRLGWLPMTGWGTWEHIIMPAFVLGFAQSALIARLTRASLLQVLNEDYIRTARAKGLHERKVITLHALKNSMIPVVTILGPLTAFLVTGSFVTEIIFSIPGIGRYFVSSISARDYGVVMGTTLLFAFFLVFANLMVDIVYAWLDPRIRYT